MGAGDGGYVLHRARSEPSTLAIAIDASPDALAAGSWRAKRARLANAAFLVEGIERLPSALAQVADEVTVHFPWGSLLRGVLHGDRAVLGPIAGLLRPHGELRLLLSATPRDGFAEATPETLHALAHEYACLGLELLEVRSASVSDVAASRSSWAKRLRRGGLVVFARYSRRSSRRGLTSAGTPCGPQSIHSTRKRPS
ncbi:MAG TPA: class I SAM-dependent methyltransferase [Candidatus Limnocylindria bacterium]|nr:class I SAM-dependent methyltransferase [Candidatus Limnocylindria bacterium]